MARIVARNAGIFAGGRNLTGRLNTAAFSLTAEAPDVTVFGDDDRERLSGGIKDAELSFSGFYDASGSQIGESLKDLLTGSTYYGFYYQSTGGASAPGREFGGVMTEYTLDESVEGAAAVSATVSGSSPIYLSLSLGNYALSGQNTTASTGDSVDFAGSTANQITVFRVMGLGRSNGNEEVSACFQHSANDSAWTTACVFTTASSGSSIEYTVTCSASRYRRLRYKFSGTSPFSASIMASSGSLAS